MPDPGDKQTDYLAPTPLPGDPPRYHISEQALDSITPIADKLGEWIPEGMTVLFVSPEDVKAAGGPQAYYRSLPRYIKNRIPSKDIFDSVKDCIERSASNFGAAAVFYIDNPTFGIVLMPHLSTQKEDFLASSIPHLSSGDLENIPGTDAEWRAMICAHEIAHLHQYSRYNNQYKLAYEIDADQQMCQWFQGVNSEVARCFLSRRTIVDMFHTLFDHIEDNTHMTAASVKSARDDVMMVGETDKETVKKNCNAMKSVKDAMVEEIGLLWHERSYPGIRDHVNGTSKWAQIIDYNLFKGKDFPLIFQAAKNVYESGLLWDAPEGKMGNQIVWEFLEAARQYAPTYFGVENPEQPFPVPHYQRPVEPLPPPPIAPVSSMNNL